MLYRKRTGERKNLSEEVTFGPESKSERTKDPKEDLIQEGETKHADVKRRMR
jgi:hypothetical protein